MWSHYRALLLFAATALAIWAFGLILWPFIVPVAWALCLCAVTARPYRWLARRTRRPRLAAFLLVLATAAVIVGPTVGVVVLVAREAAAVDLTPALGTLKERVPGIFSWLDGVSRSLHLGSFVAFVTHVEERLPDLASQVLSGGAFREALGVLLAPFVFLFGLLVTLVTQYFVYREAPRLRRVVIEISPLLEDETDRVLHTLHATTAAALVGGLLVALLQGLLGAFMFVIVGIQSPALWGVVMAALSLLPFGGTAFVWLPAAAYLMITGDMGSAWFVVGFGTLIVGGADNVLRPWILSRTGARDLHPLLLFFGILSGIGLFGISGIVFGPLLLALLMTMVKIYREHVRPAGAASAAP